MTRPPIRGLGVGTLVVVLVLGAPATLAKRPRIYAIVGATVTMAPGQTIESGTVVMRDGLIEAAGAGVAAPPDAMEIDGTGRWVYSGFIDADSGLPPPPTTGTSDQDIAPGEPASGAMHPLPRVHPERRALDALRPFRDAHKRDVVRYRGLGFTLVEAVPPDGIFRGRSAVVLLLDETPVRAMVLRETAAHHVAFERGAFGQGYPASLMGSAAVIRQVLLDARRHSTWSGRYRGDPTGLARPERLPAFEALTGALDRSEAVVFHLGEPQDALLADRLAREFNLDAVLSATGHEWELAQAVAASGRTLILPVAFPDEPEVANEDEALDVSLRELRRYLEAPSAARRLHEAGVRFAFTTRGLANPSEFAANVRRMIEDGLPESVALAALTTVPASLLGIERVAGTLEPGKIANVVVADGPIFGADTKVRRVFVDGNEYRIEEKEHPRGDPDAVEDPRGEWSVVFETAGRTVRETWTLAMKAGSWSGSTQTDTGTVAFRRVALEGNLLTLSYTPRGGRGVEVVVVVEGDTLEGTAELGIHSVPVRGRRTRGPEGGS